MANISVKCHICNTLYFESDYSCFTGTCQQTYCILISQVSSTCTRNTQNVIKKINVQQFSFSV